MSTPSEQNLTSILSISISSFNEKYVDGKTVTFYQLQLTSNITKTSWTLEKRYSDFKNLHTSLKALIPNVPSIPSTTFFRVSSIDALTKRRIELEKFIQECVFRKEILMNQLTKDFLEIEKNAPELIGNEVIKKYEYTRCPLGVRGFILLPHREIFLLCCSDMNIMSRADSMISNISMPWDKSNDTKVPLGAAFVYQCKPDPKKKEDYIIHKIWVRSYPIQTGVISWDDIDEMYCVGNDDGAIYLYKHKEGSKYTDFDSVAELRYHRNRVMGVAYDSKTKCLYSCSTDRTFYVCDLSSSQNAYSLVCSSDAGYTNLEYDQKNNRVFLTDEYGVLSCFITTSYPPMQVLNLYTTSNNSIRAFHVDYINKYIFTGSVNGMICIMNLGDPGKEKFISQISSFQITNMKIRVCKYNKNGHVLMTGDEVGRVTIWSLKTGKPIYMWEAHPKSAITTLFFEQKENLLWTGGKDKCIRVWKLPEKFESSEVSNFQSEGIQQITESLAIMKIEKASKKNGEDYDSSDDDLNGWDFRPY
jgi:WD40 repeat protein